MALAHRITSKRIILQQLAWLQRMFLVVTTLGRSEAAVVPSTVKPFEVRITAHGGPARLPFHCPATARLTLPAAPSPYQQNPLSRYLTSVCESAKTLAPPTPQDLRHWEQQDLQAFTGPKEVPCRAYTLGTANPGDLPAAAATGSGEGTAPQGVKSGNAAVTENETHEAAEESLADSGDGSGGNASPRTSPIAPGLRTHYALLAQQLDGVMARCFPTSSGWYNDGSSSIGRPQPVKQEALEGEEKAEEGSERKAGEGGP